MKLSKLLFAGFLVGSLSACGVDDKIAEAEEALAELEELEAELGEDGVSQSDVELALSEMFDDELTEGDEGTSISVSDADFQDAAATEDVASVDEEEGKKDPSKKLLIAEKLDMMVEHIFDAIDADGDDFLTLDEFKNGDLIGAGAKLPEFRAIIFASANSHCPDKDDDTDTLHPDEVRCMLKVIIVKKVKKHYDAYPEGDRDTKRKEKRIAKMKKFKKDKGFEEGKELTEEEKTQLKEKIAAKKAKFAAKKEAHKKLKDERKNDPTAYSKRVSDRRTARAAAQPAQ